MYSSRTVALKGGLQRFLKPLIDILKINLSWIHVENFIRSLRCLHKELFFQSIRHHLHWLTHVHCLHPDCKQQRTATWIRKLPLQVLFSPQHNIHQPSQQQKIASLKSSLVTIKTSETQKKKGDGLNQAAGIEQHLSEVQLGWIPKKRCAEIVHKYRGVRALAGVYWHQEEFSRGYSFPVPHAFHCITGKRESSKKCESLSQNNLLPTFIPSLCFPVIPELPCWSWRRTEAATLLCWGAGPLLVLGWFLQIQSEPVFCCCCRPFTLLEEHREFIKGTTLLPGNSSARKIPGGIF